MERRTVLRTVAAGTVGSMAALAGCTGGDDGPEEPERPENVPPDDPVDADAVVAATRDRIDENSYRWEYELTIRGLENDDLQRLERQSFTLDRDRSRASIRTEEDIPGFLEGEQELYVTEAETFLRRRDEDDELTYERQEDGFDEYETLMSEFVAERIAPLIGPHEFGVGEWDGEREAFVAPLVTFGGGDEFEDLDDVTGALRVAPVGVLDGTELEGDDHDHDQHVDVETTFRPTDDVSIEEPNWLEEAREET